MSRDIKFRVWDIEMGEMWTWEEMQEDWESEGYYDSVFRGDHWEPMQFTGEYIVMPAELKKPWLSSKEIYESDIIRGKYWCEYANGGLGAHRRIIGAVTFEHGAWYIKGCGRYKTWHLLKDVSQRVILGNIHENPELLK